MKLRFVVLAVLASLGLVLGTVPASAATTSGGRASGSAQYISGTGVRSWGTVTSTGGACVHAEVKLRLAGVNDYSWKEKQVCNRQSDSWNTTHRGPILSNFPSSKVQGIDLRVCKVNDGGRDDCGNWERIGG